MDIKMSLEMYPTSPSSEEEVDDDIKELLVLAKSNKDMAVHLRTRYGVKAVKKLVEKGFFDVLEMIFKDAQYPFLVRYIALKRYLKMYLEKNCDFYDLLYFYEDKEEQLSPGMKRLVCNEIQLVSRRYIKKLAKEGNFYELIEISKDENLPETIRNTAKDNIELAHIKYVNKLAQKRDFDKLMSIAENNELSENIRTIAGLKIVSRFIDNLQLSQLISFSQNEKLPETVRNTAKDNIELAHIKYVNKLAQKRDFDKLMSIAENNELSENIRTIAGLKIVSHFIDNLKLSKLISFSENNN
ncbi:MAG: hypothetical protein QXF86_04660, partial [Candidatus Bilamarchaeaceae archaeon]